MTKKLIKKTTKKPPRKKAGRPPLTEDTPLTRKQELFVRELISKDGQITKREAAINAGFAPRSAHTRAYEMCRMPHVAKEIRRYRAELDAKYAPNYERHVRDLQIIRDLALENKAYSAAVQAEVRRGMAEGDIYISKSEVRHGTIDQMSKDEVLAALKELEDNYGNKPTIEIFADYKEPKGKNHGSGFLEDDEGSDEEIPPEPDLDEA